MTRYRRAEDDNIEQFLARETCNHMYVYTSNKQ